MKTIYKTLLQGTVIFLFFTLICGGLYTLSISGIASIFFPNQANGSLIETDGKSYAALLGQSYSDPAHMWGRIMILDTTTYKDENGHPLLYAMPSNDAVASQQYESIIQERIDLIHAANPKMYETPIPIDLVTVSGSGLDPHISVAAANYQIKRIADANHISEADVQAMIEQCTTHRLFHLFGEENVNVLEVNLKLDSLKKSGV